MKLHYTLYTGSYTSQTQPAGIHVLSFNGEELSVVHTNTLLKSPSYLIENRDKLYAVEEYTEGASISEFTIGRHGLQLRQTIGAPGFGMCHVTVADVIAYGSNYNSGSIVGVNLSAGTVCAFLQHEGKGPNPNRQEGPHVHSSQVSPGGKELFVADLGLDKIMRYDRHADGALVPHPTQPFVSIEPGEGPRHFTFSSDGKYMYLITELKCTLLTYTLEGGQLVRAHSLPLFPAGMPAGASGADIHLAPSGKFLYCSVRGADQILGFALDSQGKPSLIGGWSSGGSTPRSFHISPDGVFLAAANQDSGTIDILPLCAETGALGSVTASIAVPMVSCVKWAGSVC